jgi:hypothetical protein
MLKGSSGSASSDPVRLKKPIPISPLRPRALDKNIARLNGLRLAKEAADREAAKRERRSSHRKGK